MTLTVNLFAAIRDLAAAGTVAVELPPGATVADLRRELVTRFPQMSALLARSAIAVNHDFAQDVVVLQPTDEVAVIPPVSGG
jgi:molybdopterin converting factor subunit 1